MNEFEKIQQTSYIRNNQIIVRSERRSCLDALQEYERLGSEAQKRLNEEDGQNGNNQHKRIKSEMEDEIENDSKLINIDEGLRTGKKLERDELQTELDKSLGNRPKSANQSKQSNGRKLKTQTQTSIKNFFMKK